MGRRIRNGGKITVRRGCHPPDRSPIAGHDARRTDSRCRGARGGAGGSNHRVRCSDVRGRRKRCARHILLRTQPCVRRRVDGVLLLPIRSRSPRLSIPQIRSGGDPGSSHFCGRMLFPTRLLHSRCPKLPSKAYYNQTVWASSWNIFSRSL